MTDAPDRSLSRLTPVKIREVWKHEAHDFTTWMLANADVLGDVLGMQLELTEAERKVGGFSLDLIGKDLVTEATVIVENQLEQTNHTHLGQLLTYAGGTDPTTIVWCAPSFREEHRAALDWLNDRTDENTRFFGVQVAAVQIDDSRPAPLFTLVAKPNNWAKQVHAQKAATLTPKSEAYREFWTRLLSAVQERDLGWTTSTTGPAASWMTLPYGTSTIYFSLSFSQQGPVFELYFGSSDADQNKLEFARWLGRQDELEASFGRPLQWQELPGKKACRIRYAKPGGGEISTGHDDEYLAWFLDEFGRFRASIFQVKPTLPPAANPID